MEIQFPADHHIIGEGEHENDAQDHMGKYYKIIRSSYVTPCMLRKRGRENPDIPGFTADGNSGRERIALARTTHVRGRLEEAALHVNYMNGVVQEEEFERVASSQLRASIMVSQREEGRVKILEGY